MDPREEFINRLVREVIDEADKQGADRDEFMEFVAFMFSAMAECATFQHYEKEDSQ